MTPVTSASPVTAPDAGSATPAHHPAQPRTGPLRSGNPRGNPNLAPRCGAKARTTGCPCRAPAMPNSQAGKDWRPAATAARQRLADDTNRQRTRLDPLRGSGAPEADSVRTSHLPGDP